MKKFILFLGAAFATMLSVSEASAQIKVGEGQISVALESNNSYYAPDKSERGVAEFLGLGSAWGVGDYIKAMKNYRAMHVMEILHLIRLADAQSKGAEGTQLPDGEIMRELLYKILH